MRAVAKKALALLATAFVLIAFVALPVSASSGVTGIVQQDGEYYYYVNGVKQIGLGFFYYDGNYYYCRSNGMLAVGNYWITTIHSSAAHLSDLVGNSMCYFDEMRRFVFPVSGADSPSDYEYSYNITSVNNPGNIEHTVYSVDRQNWIPYQYPFKDKGMNYKYCAYYTYVPAIASLPLSYTFPQNTFYVSRYNESTSATETNLVLQYKCFVTLRLGTTDDGLATMSIDTESVDANGNTSWSGRTFIEGTDFESTCIYIGNYYSFAEDFSTSGGPTINRMYACFIIDGEYEFYSLIDFPWTWEEAGYTFYFPNGGDYLIDAYSLGFATTYAGSATDGTIEFTEDEFKKGYARLYNWNRNSDNWQEWLATLYENSLSAPTAPPGVTMDDVIKVLEGGFGDINDLINYESSVQPPPVKLPTSSQNSQKDDIVNSSNEISIIIDSVMGDIDNMIGSTLVAPPSDLTDYIMLASVFTQMGNWFFQISGFDLIVTGLTFVFLMWILGLNLSSIRHSAEFKAREADRAAERADRSRYRNEQRAYWKWKMRR